MEPKADPQTILLVTDRRSVGNLLGDALERAGFEVIGCPGPQPSDYVCAAGRGRRCVLAEAVEAVVLDCDLASDAVPLGTPSWHLLWYYRNLGKPVIVLAHADELPGPVGDVHVTVLPRSADGSSVVSALRDALADEAESA